MLNQQIDSMSVIGRELNKKNYDKYRNEDALLFREAGNYSY